MRTIAAAAVAAITVVSLAGCGQRPTEQPAASSPTSTSAPSSTSSPKTTSSTAASATSSSSTTASSFTKPAAGGKVDAAAFTDTVWGAVDAAKSVKLALSVPGEETIKMVVAKPGPNRTDLEMSDGESGSMRIVDGSLYFPIPPEERQNGKSWVVVDKNTESPMGKMMSMALSSMTSMAQGDLQRGAMAKAAVTFVGDEKDGAHYRVAVPATSMLDAMQKMFDTVVSGAGASASSSMAKEMKQARTKLAGKTVSYDYWLDASERPAVVVADLSSFQGAMADGELPKDAMGPAKMTVRYSEWNVPVRVVAPPAAQTMSFDEAMKSMGDAGMFGPGGTGEETASSSASSPA